MERLQKQQILMDLNKKIVFIIGPRQVGKTWLAKDIAKNFNKPVYLNYDSIQDKKIIHSESWLNSTDLLILDELHKMKRWKNHLKGIFDTKPEKMKILVTGSARLATFQKSGDSLAGRFFSHTLFPFSPRFSLLVPAPPYSSVLIPVSPLPVTPFATDRSVPASPRGCPPTWPAGWQRSGGRRRGRGGRRRRRVRAPGGWSGPLWSSCDSPGRGPGRRSGGICRESGSWGRRSKPPPRLSSGRRWSPGYGQRRSHRSSPGDGGRP